MYQPSKNQSILCKIFDASIDDMMKLFKSLITVLLQRLRGYNLKHISFITKEFLFITKE